MKGVETEADWVTAFGDGDYTTNMGLEDVPTGRRGSRTSRTARRWTPSTAGLSASLRQVERKGR